MVDETHKKYTRLFVVKRAENNKRGDVQFLCKCDCGKSIVVKGASLREGNTKSCGCLKKDYMTIYGKNENNGMWCGDDVKYNALHEWIKNNKEKPEFCECCRLNPPLDLANISGEYKRDISDFEWLCRKCHMIKDGRINNLKNVGAGLALKETSNKLN